MGSGVSKAAEDVVIKIVDAIQNSDTAALKTTLNSVFSNMTAFRKEHAALQKEHAALQKDHAVLKAELNELKKKTNKQSDSATVRLTVPSTVADPDDKDANGQAALGIKHMTTVGHEERLDQIQK